MAAPSVGTCVSEGINGFKKDPVTHIVATILVMFLSAVAMGLLAGPLMVGYMRMMKTQDEGGKAQIGDLFKGFDDFVPALVAVLLGSIAVSIGFMFCVLPGLLVAAIVPTAAYLVAMGEKDGVVALKRAWAAVKANLVAAFLCMLVLGLISQLGLIACLIGVLVTMPIGLIGMYHMAKQITDDGTIADA